MLERHKHQQPVRTFDGIVDDRGQTIPRGFTLFFYALVVWGALFSAYYLLSGWSSRAEFEATMGRSPASAASTR